MIFKKSFQTSLIVGCLLLSGCSKYPSEGVVDTRSVREFAEIKEVSGTVYGIKNGAIEKIESLKHDDALMHNARGAVWKSIFLNNPIEKMEPKLIEQSQFDEMIDLLTIKAKEKKLEVEEGLNNDIEKLKVKIVKFNLKKEEFELKISGYRKIAGNNLDIIGVLEQRKVDLKKSRNAIISSALEKVNAIAEKNSITAITKNPLSSYANVDIKNGDKECPEYKGRLEVNLIKEKKKCLFFRFDDELMKQSSKISSALKYVLLKLSEIESELGENKIWGTSTGIYAKIEKAKKSGKKAKSHAEDKYGRFYRLESNLERAKNNLNSLSQQLSQLQSKDHQEYMMSTTSFFPKIEQSFSISELRQKIFTEYFEKVSDVIAGEKNAEFSGMSGDYENALIVTEMLIGGLRRGLVESINIIDLNDENVQKSDMLKVTVQRRDLYEKRSSEKEERLIRRLFLKLSAFHEKQLAS